MTSVRLRTELSFRPAGVSKDQILADCWSIGYEHRFGTELRLQQAFLYARLGPDEHLYAHPLDLNAVVDSNNKKVLKIGESSKVEADGSFWR